MPFKPIHSLHDRYGADDKGNIYRLTQNASDKPLKSPRQIKPIRNPQHGYLQINAYTVKHRMPYVHKVVAEHGTDHGQTATKSTTKTKTRTTVPHGTLSTKPASITASATGAADSAS